MLESSWVHVVSLAPWRFPSLSCFNVSSFALLCFLFSVVFSFLVLVFSICLLVTSCFTLKYTFLSCVSFTFLDYVHPSNLETFVDMLQWSSVYPSKHFDAEHCCLFLTSVGEMMLEFQPYLLGCTRAPLDLVFFLHLLFLPGTHKCSNFIIPTCSWVISILQCDYIENTGQCGKN